LLPDSASSRDTDALLTVREAASALKVSTATVYKLCGSGELDHVRILNLIRIPERALRRIRTT
jgi:excisionase family DNA binding protein